jgi:hypothetical protein
MLIRRANLTTVPLGSSGVEVEVSASEAGAAERMTANIGQSNNRDAKAENSQFKWSKL